MKKRVVAVLLSLSMCMATAAEATAVSAAEFSAEIAVTEDNEEPVTDLCKKSLSIEQETAVVKCRKSSRKDCLFFAGTCK